MTENTVMNLAQENMDLVRTWVNAINRNDIEAELACWQPDGEFFVAPTGTTYRGIAEIRQAGERSASVIGGQPIQGRKQITHLDAGEDWAVVEYDSHADIQGPILLWNVTVLPEGVMRTVVTKACVIFQMREGKIHRAQEFFDMLSMPQQLGLDRVTLEKMYASLASKPDFASNEKAVRTAKETVRLFFDAWNRKDLDGLVALLGAQVNGRNPLSGQENAIAKEDFRTILQKNLQAFPDLHMRVDRLISDGEIVAIEELETATLAFTNQSYEMPVACFFRVNSEGMIVEIHNYWDTKTYFQQIGTDPETLSQALYGAYRD